MTPARTADELPVILFPEQQDWIAWLEEHHETATGAWLKLAKAETRARHIERFVAMLEKGEKLYP